MNRWNRRQVTTASFAVALGALGGGARVMPALAGAAWSAQPVAAAPRQRLTADGRMYDAYIQAALKEGQFARYTCEFDAAWVICKTFGRDVSLEEQVAIVGIDERVEPYIEETPDGYLVYGGDITAAFSGDYTASFLARTTGAAMRKVFDRFGFAVERVDERAGIEAALDRGALVWMKATVDFLPWEPVTWVTPEGKTLPGVLGNDHAVVVMGYNQEAALIRDVLGPTSSNWNRLYEYEVPWDTFLHVWEAQGFDGLAVAPPAETTS